MQSQRKLTTQWTAYILMKIMIKEVESSIRMECKLCGNPNSPPSDSSTMKADRSLVRFQGLSLIQSATVQESYSATSHNTKVGTIISLIIKISLESSMTLKLSATSSLSMICVSVIQILAIMVQAALPRLSKWQKLRECSLQWLEDIIKPSKTWRWSKQLQPTRTIKSMVWRSLALRSFAIWALHITLWHRPTVEFTRKTL